MANVYFVRHGEAAASFADHRDPGLSGLGRLQSKRTAHRLQEVGPLPVFTSPLMRTQETASFLAEAWKTTAKIDKRFAEVPTPSDLKFEDRPTWLDKIMRGTWLELTAELQSWRKTMIDATLGFQSDCVVFSHFVAINVIVGAATDEEMLISFRPANASITLVSNSGGELSVQYQGLEAQTKVN